MLLREELIFAILVLVLSIHTNATRLKRMYALCPPHFIRIGNECYFISESQVNWLDAHFECKDRNSRLAEPYKYEDRLLRKFLVRSDQIRSDIWIGGIFNWKRNKWQWGYNGKDLTYQSFSQMSPEDRKDLKFHCAVLNPELKYRWSARSCVDRHHYICQHRMPYVSGKNRQKVYNKWNETFPNEMANEIEVVLNEDNKLRNKRRWNKPHLQNGTRYQEHYERNHQRNSFPSDNQLENKIDYPISNAKSAKPQQRKRPGQGNRQRHIANNGLHQNDVLGNSFEPKLNRNRTYNPDKRIKFNQKDTMAQWRRNHHLNHDKRRQKQKLFASTSTTTPTIPTTASTTTISTPSITSTEANSRPDPNQQLDNEQWRLQQEEEEIRRYDERQHKKLLEQQALRRAEEKRAFEENEQREKHLKEMERRHEQMELDERQERENERIREAKQRQDEIRKLQNEFNKQKYEDEYQKQLELTRQREQEAELAQKQQQQLQQQLEQKQQQQTATESNNIPDLQQPQENGVNKDTNKRSRLLELKDKKRRRAELKARLQKLSPEEQALYFTKRNERNKKRGTNHTENSTS